ncbi:MAG: HslU--HslV peptidase proteolytic subunit [Proteobacteria bacterium]|nr:MAG: HslU--HslV peptidase proteolytic subunit [Pseudomonadota bacterium]
MQIHSTTILAIRYKGKLVLAGDGQVTISNTIMKHGANKIRRLQDGAVLAGFAGSAADAFSLFERFEGKLKEHAGQLERAVVELAKDWRSDKYLRRLEAMLIVGNSSSLYLLSGAGDVIQPDDGVVAIGSGGPFALSAARALVRQGHPELDGRQIAEHSMRIASEICPFTNDRFVFEELVCE